MRRRGWVKKYQGKSYWILYSPKKSDREQHGEAVKGLVRRSSLGSRRRHVHPEKLIFRMLAAIGVSSVPPQLGSTNAGDSADRTAGPPPTDNS